VNDDFVAILMLLQRRKKFATRWPIRSRFGFILSFFLAETLPRLVLMTLKLLVMCGGGLTRLGCQDARMPGCQDASVAHKDLDRNRHVYPSAAGAAAPQ